MESISVFDIFKVGVGPSSSHTMGPWRAAQAFLASCPPGIRSVGVDLYGSLAKTGKGHGTDVAVILGLAGEDPVTCDVDSIHAQVATIRATRRLALGGDRAAEIDFDPASDLRFHPDRTLAFHPNGIRFEATMPGLPTLGATYYSIGGGFIVREGEPPGGATSERLPLPIETPSDLVRHCREQGMTIPEVVLTNERTWRDDAAIRRGLATIWETMRRCIHRGAQTSGILPGGLGVVRRAAAMNRKKLGDRSNLDVDAWVEAIRGGGREFREILGWVSCFALAVNEENAAFGRVVTAPTNGAAGVIPAVILYYLCFCEGVDAGVDQILLTAGEVGSLFKKGATLSAAMGGCQAEIGVSSAMAASGLCVALGGSTDQALMAAEIAMEHHLGLTCDPVGGLVQVPCIERNTMGAIKAITACNIALAGDPKDAKVTLDAVIRSMWATAQDMNTKYKETSEGGLAIQIPVNLSEC